MARTSALHVRVDDELKADAAEKLASFGQTVSDAVRILLTRDLVRGPQHNTESTLPKTATEHERLFFKSSIVSPPVMAPGISGNPIDFTTPPSYFRIIA